MSSKTPSSEYSGSAVPTDATVSGWQVALTKLGVVVALPAFVMGAKVGGALGLKAALASMALGGIMLMIMGTLTGAVAAKSRLSTSLITQFAFGRLGGRLVNAILAVTLLGWFGVTAQIFAQGVRGIALDFQFAAWPMQIYAVIGGAMMIATTIFGFSALRRLSDITIPLLMIVLLVATYRGLQTTPLDQLLAISGETSDLGLGISAVAGGLAASICVFPDLCRFSRSTGDALLASGLTYGLGVPVVLGLSAVISLAAGSQDLITILTTLGLGIPALLLLVFKAWTTNAGNLYSASLGFSTIVPNVPRTMLVIAAGSVGILLAVLGITDALIPFLLLLSITIPPIAGIYVVDFFLIRSQHYDLDRLTEEPAISASAFGAWALGISVATITSHGMMSLSGMPAADSILASSALYLLFARYLSPLFGRTRATEK
ncbi:cytosine permease [Sphingomonas crocodyli]|uniref:Cytosine permease n=1 Tax=Sphingomonas crocodyli TaxID=1979270 RepID=A0A437M6Y1_9SPHN|nr:cytosine permease [Sphingomonas crocodyli]RVT93470.1 hypothetical protein EOD43_06225 [Sphingomonas crocodyli]